MDAYIRCIGQANAESLEKLYMKKPELVLTKKLDAYFVELYADKWKAEAKAETLLKILWKKFNKVPKKTEKAICKMTDPVALDSLAIHAATCQSLKEFAAEL